MGIGFRYRTIEAFLNFFVGFLPVARAAVV